MGRNQVYCCICGGPFLESGTRENEPGEWLCHPTLWTTVHNAKDGPESDMYKWELGMHTYLPYDLVDPVEDSQRRVLEQEATYQEHNMFLISESGEKVPAFHVVGNESALYLAAHGKCSQLVQRFISSRPETHDVFQISDKDEISSVKQLWQVIFTRIPASGRGFAYNVDHPTRYYGITSLHLTEWEPDNNPLAGECVEADPIEVPQLTECILDNLELYVPGIRSEATSTDLEDQDRGYNKLINKKELPWLWDLDEDVVRKKQRTGDWNWELLVDKLSGTDIYRPEDETLRLPLGLRNRRRIWKCIEDARLGDIQRQIGPPLLGFAVPMEGNLWDGYTPKSQQPTL
ncbi:unnamed protein product [Clonostachys byssicola]|uniref:Uncharacterized protein n=1 Tax=Clonostachys byssicola TaxID=160290 RepID=A0A9N9Y0B0_9HYPO|nr:unnamed protein product [Clonostachys byssicola]